MTKIAFEDKVLGGLYGLLIGDALGVPYEFSKAERLPPSEQLEMTPPAGFRRAHPSTPPGTWSDDGAQALCLLASLLSCGELDIEDFAERLVNWAEDGYLAVDERVFDIGIQTRAALTAISSGVPLEQAAPPAERNNGNGSLMRVLPLVLWHMGSDEDLIEAAARQSIPTHSHPRSQVCCALYCLWARAIMNEQADPWSLATAKLRGYCTNKPVWQRELEEHIAPDRAPSGSGSGYVVDCLHSARLAFEEPDFERVVKRAVALGDDTDTTAAVAGGVAGLRFGLSGIPERWRTTLRGAELVTPLREQLLARRGA